MVDIHTAAHQGYSTGAPSYARGRPDYPAELLPWLSDKLGLSAQKTVVDLGAGTGKFTKLLLQTGAEVIAVEPVAAIRQQLALALPQVRVLDGTAETIPLPGASADAVVCAQAFHWFATETALREIHRILKPESLLGLIWNVRDESVDWVAAITEIITRYEGDTPRFYKGDWLQAFNLETAVDRLDMPKIHRYTIGCDFDHRHLKGESATGQSARLSGRQAALQLLEISRYFYVAVPCLTAR